MRGKRTGTAVAILSITLAFAVLLSGQVKPVYQVIVALDPVAIDVAITDMQGRAVTGLTRDDFTVYEDGQPQPIREVLPVGMPYSILVLVDRSGREDESHWPKFVITAVDLFLRSLRSPDRLAVAAFDDRVAVLVDWRPSREGTVQKVLLRKSAQPTKFFKAMNWASEEMEYIAAGGAPSQPPFKGRRGVIVFTDGRDIDMYPQYQRIGGQNIPDPLYQVPASADQQFEASRHNLAAGKVPFYFVAMDTDRQLSDRSAAAKLDGWVRFLKEVRTRIEELASASGGRAAFPNRIEDLAPFYDQIQEDLGTGYHITYTPQRPADGNLRRIEVHVQNPDLDVYQSQNRYVPR